ncbi:hypothetical protein PR048_019415 [Dryococelus australis]|uniref:Uncharacterized protein n=1 Tax=Dryococelus australis TaxID=614101 RepID=A0ABQ9H3I0_9NEOP|nr:hypothetical protein PR048_019415 [Dryococelus australis]
MCLRYWLLNSESTGNVFWLHCLLFQPISRRTSFPTGFNDWKLVSEELASGISSNCLCGKFPFRKRLYFQICNDFIKIVNKLVLEKIAYEVKPSCYYALIVDSKRYCSHIDQRTFLFVKSHFLKLCQRNDC